jgi:hypothetical protein
MRGEEVVHDDKVDLAPSRQLDTVKSVEAGEQRVRVALDVLVIILEDRPEELVLRMRDGLDDESIVTGEVKEGARLSRRPKLRQNVLGRERQEIIRGVKMEMLLAQVAENPRSVILELKVVFGGGSELVADTRVSAVPPDRSHVKRVLVSGKIILVCERAFYLRLATRYLGSAMATIVSTHSYADAGEHIVHQDIVDVILSDEVSDQYPGLLLNLPLLVRARLLLPSF